MQRRRTPVTRVNTEGKDGFPSCGARRRRQPPRGGAPGIAAGCWGGSQVGRADVRPRGGHEGSGMGGFPVKLGAGELCRACGRVQLAITMSLCASTAVPNGAEKRPCRAPVGNGGPLGAPGYMRVCVCVCTLPGGCACPKGGGTPRCAEISAAFAPLGTPSPRGSCPGGLCSPGG